MARKKKEIIQENFTPSPYQQAIFDFIQHEQGNLVIEASAGSGKSSTLIKALDLIPTDKKILFCAFNTDIVKELKKKIGKRDNVDIRTVHSLGLNMVCKNVELDNYVPNGNKYRTHLFANLSNYASFNTYTMPKKMLMKYMNNIIKLVEHGRNNLSQTKEDLEKLVYRHDIDIIADEIDVTLMLMSWGKTTTESIDYTDMVWLPNALYLQPYGLQYDYIFVDEAQDLSVAQRELLLKCQKINTRYIYVGDSNQSIYSFASASPESFKAIKSMPNTTSLPLSISYRCSKNIVNFAKNYVPTIEAKEDAIDGEIKYNCNIEEVQDGDMVLCRNNAPLMQAYNMFIRQGKKCYIKGKDIGQNLISIVDSVDAEILNADLSNDGVFLRLYADLYTKRDAVSVKENLPKQIVKTMPFYTNRMDMIKALETLADGINTATELKERIKTIFTDKKSEGISLSTIHKAKGLEADNVYIACQSLMPSKNAKQDWEKEQEQNLIYVAYTRAKQKLGFLKEDYFKNFLENNPTYNDNESIIELKISRFLGKTFISEQTTATNSPSFVFPNQVTNIKIPKRGITKTIGNSPKTIGLGNPMQNMMKHKTKKIKI